MKTVIALIALTILAGCSNFAKVDAYAIPEYQIGDKIIQEEVFIGMYYSNASKRYDGKFKPFHVAPKGEYERISTANAGRVLISMMRDNTKVVSKKSEKDAVLNVYINGHDVDGAMTKNPLWLNNTFYTIITLTLGALSYDLVADFDVTYELVKGDKILFKKNYDVFESLGHKESAFSSFNVDIDASMELFEKHIRLTNAQFWNDFKQG